MKIQVFKTDEFAKANDFIKTVDLHEQGVQVSSDNEIIIFYNDKLSDKDFKIDLLEKAIDRVEKNIIHNELNKVGFVIEANKAEPEKKVEKAELLSRANKNDELFKEQLKAYKKQLKACK